MLNISAKRQMRRERSFHSQFEFSITVFCVSAREICGRPGQLFSPLEIYTLCRIDSNPISLFYKGRYLNGDSGLELRWFGAIGSRSAFHFRLSFDNGQLNCWRQLYAHRLSFEELNLDLCSGDKVVDGLAQRLGIERDLVVGLGVHEMVRVGVGIEEFHLVLFERRPFYVLG